MKSKPLLVKSTRNDPSIRIRLTRKLHYLFRKSIPYLAVLLGIYILMRVLYSTLFYVRKITFGLGSENTEIQLTIKNDLVDILGKNIIALNTDQLQSTIIQNHRQFKSIIIQKELPDTLVVSFLLNQSSYYLKYNSMYYSINEEGVVFNEEKNLTGTEVPIVEYSGNTIPQFDQIFQPLADANLSELFNFEWDNIGVEVQNYQFIDYFVINLYDTQMNVEVTLWLQKLEINRQLDELKSIFTNQAYRNKHFKEIDLRFDRAVIRYQ